MRFTIKLKLFLAFGFIMAILAGTAGYGIVNLGALNDTLGHVITGPAARLSLAQELNILQLQQIRQQKNMLSATSTAETNKYIAVSDKARADFDTAFQEVTAKATEQGKAFWTKLDALTARFRQQDDRIRGMMLAGDAAGALRVSASEARTVATDIDALLAEVVELEHSRLQEADDQAEAQYADTRTIMIAVASIAFVIAGVAAFWIVLSINRGLGRAVGAVQNVADGDLSRFADITTRDEIGDLLGHVNTMIERLRGVVADALSASDNVSSGSQELSEIGRAHV